MPLVKKMKNKKHFILIVDDEEVMRSLFMDLLTEHGYTVLAANNGQEAVEKVKKTNFSIIFIDVHMPVMNGVEALLEIKEIKPQVPVVMLDSFPDVLIEQSKKGGAISCIHKPFEIHEILKIIEEATEQKVRK